MTPNLEEIGHFLTTHPDWVFECEIRSKGWVRYDEMSDEEFEEFGLWLEERGFEMCEYIDRDSLLLDAVWVNTKHQQAIERLRTIVKEFQRRREKYRNPSMSIRKLAHECYMLLES